MEEEDAAFHLRLLPLAVIISLQRLVVRCKKNTHVESFTEDSWLPSSVRLSRVMQNIWSKAKEISLSWPAAILTRGAPSPSCFWCTITLIKKLRHISSKRTLLNFYQIDIHSPPWGNERQRNEIWRFYETRRVSGVYQKLLKRWRIDGDINITLTHRYRQNQWW